MPFETYLIVSLVILVTLVFLVMQQKKRENMKKEIANLLARYGVLSNTNGQMQYQIGRSHYRVMFFYLPEHSELTINSRVIWELRSTGKPRLINQSEFLKGETKKIIIVYPSNAPIKRYINENEMEFIHYQTEFYNMRVLRVFEISDWAKEELT